MKYNRIIIISCLLLSLICVKAQRKIDFHVDGNLYANKNTGMWSGQAYMIYNLSDRIGLGGGLEYIGTQDNYTSLPVFVTAHYSPIKNTYLFVDGKYAPIQSGNDMASGVMASVGCGYTRMFSSRIGINFKIGYDMNHLVRKGGTDNINGLLVGLGIVF